VNLTHYIVSSFTLSRTEQDPLSPNGARIWQPQRQERGVYTRHSSRETRIK
jgi:hypothetical protein